MINRLSMFHVVSALAAVTFVWTLEASAQTRLDRPSIVRSLGGVDTAAREFDVEELQREVRRRVDTNQPADQGLPIFQRLNRLPQMTVEVVFDFNRSEVRPQSYVTLGRMADALHHPVLAPFSFLVIGHTDAVGGREPNLELSQRRADAIVEALTTTFGVAPGRLIGVGMGEEQLRDAANPEAQANRRVQLITIGRTR